MDEKQKIVRQALIEKFEGASNKELMQKYKEQFRSAPDMYSQFRSYLFALAKTHPETILKLLKSTKEVVMKNISRSMELDMGKRLSVTKAILLGERYMNVAEKHDLSISRARGIFVEVVLELSEKHSLGIPKYYGKKQIIHEHKDRLIDVIDKTLKKQPIKKGRISKKSPKKQSPKRSKK